MMQKTVILFLLVLAGNPLFAQTSNLYTNTIRFSPVSVTYDGFGMGLSYEKWLDKEGKIAVNIPFNIAINNNSYYSNIILPNSKINFSYLISPGIRFYPFGQSHKVIYGVGFAVFFNYAEDSYYSSNAILINQHYTLTGTLITNSVDFNITQHLRIGMEFGIGPSYFYRRNTNASGNDTYGIELFPQLDFRIGYRL